MWTVAAVKWKFDGVPSDHLPVTVRLMKKPSDGFTPVVRPWIANSEAFSKALERLWVLRAVSSNVGALG
eukprot:16230702-Heterocapsa_arctica.AAC.1